MSCVRQHPLARPTIVLIEGTWGGDDWAAVGSPFRKMLAREGFGIAPEFVWSENVSGLPRFITLASRKHSDWKAGGYAFALFARDYAGANVIAHSHGGPVVAYGCAKYGAKVHRLITVGTPPRRDMDKVWFEAKQNIGYWAHVTDTGGDFMQFLGGLFDLHIGRLTVQEHADRNIPLDDIGHSGLFRDPNKFHHWPKLLAFFRQPKEKLIGARDI